MGYLRKSLAFCSLLIFSDISEAADSDRGGDCASHIFFDFEQHDKDRIYTELQSGNWMKPWKYFKKCQAHLGAQLIVGPCPRCCIGTDYKKWVCCVGVPLGYGTFDIIKAGALTVRTDCPQCGEHIDCDACCFNNCYFKVRGRKKVGTVIIVPWEKIGDQIIEFRKDKGVVHWLDLRIECRKLTDPPPQDDDF